MLRFRVRYDLEGRRDVSGGADGAKKDGKAYSDVVPSQSSARRRSRQGEHVAVIGVSAHFPYSAVMISEKRRRHRYAYA